MRVPLTWLRDYVDLPVEVEPREVAARLVAVGLEVETVHSAGGDVSGPLVVGQVLDFSDETHRNGKTIRWCQVDVGEAQPRGIVCGALNFSRDDLVVVALPGAVLPGGFEISARKTYGHVSDGMICSARELGLGDDHTGIMVLVPGEGRPGDDAHQLLRLSDDVLDIAVTPDRGYCLSMRGIARETATAYDLPFRDPAAIDVSHEDDGGYPVHVEEPAGCPVFVARTVTDLDPRVPSPRWLQRRVQLAGMRPISLIVDVTNYVMLELGQPIHAYDRARLQGPIGVRRARSGERLRTLDGVVRDLRPDDLLITDESGPIGLAGVMGGASTEIHTDTTDVVIEAAHFDAGTIARGARWHRLPSEASYRFERGVDPELPPVAAQRVVELLVELGGAKVEPGATVVSSPRRSVPIEIAADLPAEVAGRPISHEATRHRLTQVGCTLTGDADLLVSAPSWRPDLVDPFDLVEEVVRLEGYDSIPSVLPTAPAGHGLTTRQRLRRQVGRALAAAGYVEAPSYPFVGPAALDAMGLASDDERRRMVRLVNPLSDEEPFLRTTLLPGLLSALRRNVGRGQADVALFESGLVFRPTGPVQAPRPPVDRRPTDAEVAALERGLPDQPERIAVALAGQREPAGWWGSARPGSWADAIEAARVIGRAAHVDLQVRKGDQAPWHPGRCAAVLLDGQVIGHAGELHPRAVQALGLPDRTSAMELDLNAVFAAAPLIVMAPRISTFPVATQDVALVVDLAVPAAAVEEALREGAGQLLESLRLFDVYTGPQVGAGKRSLAFALRFRAPDRTLTDAEALAARAAAVQLAAERTGAVLRGV